MKFHLMGYVVKYIRRFGAISVLDAYIYEQVNVHMNLVYGETLRRPAARMQKTVMLIGRELKDECLTIFTAVGSS